MPSINLDLNYFDHPKTRRLVTRLGKDSDVLPVRLWCYVGRYYAETGVLPGYTAEDVEAKVSWRGKRGQAVEAMIEVGLIEKLEDGYRVHDWFEWSGHLRSYKERAKKAAQARWAGERSKGAAPSSNDSDATSNATSNATPSNVTVLKTLDGACTKSQSPPAIFPGIGYFPALLPVAKRLVQLYQTKTQTAYDDGGGVNAVVEILAMGQATEQELVQAIERWGDYAVKTYQRDKRRSARKFFGGEAPSWQSWVSGSPIAAPQTAQQSNAQSLEELRKIGCI